LNVKLVGASRNQQDLKSKMFLNFLGADFPGRGPGSSVGIASQGEYFEGDHGGFQQ
jgi:hypothetical protein